MRIEEIKKAGYEKVAQGKLLKGDFVFNKQTNKFEEVLLDGNLLVEQCHLVVRKIKNTK